MSGHASQSLREQIESAYRNWQERAGRRERRSQREMIDFLSGFFCDLDARAACAAIEGPTGTGKTIAYLSAALPAALAFKKKLVIASSTVALQEQLVQRDLPEFARESGLDFSFALVKGRARYVCRKRLDEVIDGRSEEIVSEAPLLAGFAGTSAQRSVYRQLRAELKAGEWNGERETLREKLSEGEWARVTLGRTQCAGSSCAQFEKCEFYRARSQVGFADCLVVNQDLLLSDLIGGNHLLPPASECVFVIDEAHHWPLKARKHFSHHTSLDTCADWFAQFGLALEKFLAHSGKGGAADQRPSMLSFAAELKERLGVCSAELAELVKVVGALIGGDELTRLERGRLENDRRIGYFSLGSHSEELRCACRQAGEAWGALIGPLDRLCRSLASESSATPQNQQWLLLFGGALSRIEEEVRLWHSFAMRDAEHVAPHARWVSWQGAGRPQNLTLDSSPISVAEKLHELLWSNCHAAVLTSATLADSSGMRLFAERAGLPEAAALSALSGEFDYQKVRFQVLSDGCDPNDFERHTRSVANAVEAAALPGEGVLALFASRRQMRAACDLLPRDLLEATKVQGDMPLKSILREHEQAISRGEPSVIFGLASFAEGIDLPGKLCSHVMIAKLPFAPPFDPVALTHAEWIEQRGGNAFMELQVPEAALRLKQAAGRLLRSENDEGQITLCDERLATKRYGSLLRKALPPYRFDLPGKFAAARGEGGAFRSSDG